MAQRKFTHLDLDKWTFNSLVDEETINNLWDREIETTIDLQGHIYGESGLYVADATEVED